MRSLICLFVILSSPLAWAWGPQGHMVVAQVAENNLTPAAKKAVSIILKGDSLADVANWADFIKGNSEWAHTKTWHFVNIPDGQDYSDTEHDHEGDVVTAITEMVNTLKRRNAGALEKEQALKFIVHFVGDIHQPLHAGRPEDRGGNDIRINFEGRRSNLHALWDSLMIMKSPMDYVAYARWLDTGSAFLPPYDLPSFSFSTIIDENMDARPTIYDFSLAENGEIRVTEAYYKRNIDLMNRQLLSGGKRLAVLINSLFK